MTFYQYLRRQHSREDQVGELAKDAVSDKCWPRQATYPEKCVLHMRSSHGACKEAVDSLYTAWQEYLDSNAMYERD